MSKKLKKMIANEKIAILTDTYISKKRPSYNGGLERLTTILIRDFIENKNQIDLFCHPNFKNDKETISNNDLRIIRTGKPIKKNKTGIIKVYKTILYFINLNKIVDKKYKKIITLNYVFFLYLYFSTKKIRDKSIILWVDYLGFDWIRYFGALGFLGLITDSLITKTKRGKNLKHWSISNKTSSKLIKAGIPRQHIKQYPLKEKLKYKKSKLKYKKKNQILMSSRLVNYKRVDLGIKIFKKIQKKHPNLKLIIVGNGPQKKFLEKLINKTNLESHIKIMSNIEENKLNKLYAESKFFLHLSKLEGFCFSIQEALINNCIVIASYLDVLKETTTGEKNVYLVKDLNKIPSIISSLI